MTAMSIIKAGGLYLIDATITLNEYLLIDPFLLRKSVLELVVRCLFVVRYIIQMDF